MCGGGQARCAVGRLGVCGGQARCVRWAGKVCGGQARCVVGRLGVRWAG